MLILHSAPAKRVKSAVVEPLFYDDFNYVVEESPAEVPGTTGSAFTSSGDWTYAKAVNVTGGGVGYAYTEDNVARGKRVAAFEVKTSGSIQTDFYIAKPLAIPANVWIKMRLYGTSDSNFASTIADANQRRNKFLYPSPNNLWPVTTAEERWMLSIGRTTATNILNGDTTAPADGSFRLGLGSGYSYYAAQSGNEEEMGMNLRADYFLGATWYDILIHVDHSGAQGLYEMWAKESSSSTWLQYSEWIGGVSPTGFDWPFTEAQRAAQLGLRWPSTWGNGGGALVCPYMKLLVDEFAMYASDPR